MDLHEALEWLEERGGRWSVRATRSACVVVVVAGSSTITAPAPRLSGDGVCQALVGAVEQLKAKWAA